MSKGVAELTYESKVTDSGKATLSTRSGTNFVAELVRQLGGRFDAPPDFRPTPGLLLPEQGVQLFDEPGKMHGHRVVDPFPMNRVILVRQHTPHADDVSPRNLRMRLPELRRNACRGVAHSQHEIPQRPV